MTLQKNQRPSIFNTNRFKIGFGRLSCSTVPWSLSMYILSILVRWTQHTFAEIEHSYGDGTCILHNTCHILSVYTVYIYIFIYPWYKNMVTLMHIMATSIWRFPKMGVPCIQFSFGCSVINHPALDVHRRWKPPIRRVFKIPLSFHEIPVRW